MKLLWKCEQLYKAAVQVANIAHFLREKRMLTFAKSVLNFAHMIKRAWGEIILAWLWVWQSSLWLRVMWSSSHPWHEQKMENTRPPPLSLAPAALMLLKAGSRSPPPNKLMQIHSEKAEPGVVMRSLMAALSPESSPVCTALTSLSWTTAGEWVTIVETDTVLSQCSVSSPRSAHRVCQRGRGERGVERTAAAGRSVRDCELTHKPGHQQHLDDPRPVIVSCSRAHYMKVHKSVSLVRLARFLISWSWPVSEIVENIKDLRGVSETGAFSNLDEVKCVCQKHKDTRHKHHRLQVHV